MTIRTFESGVLIGQVDDPAATQRASASTTRRALVGKMPAAIQADLDYLALNPPTTAQAIAQVDRLTRQVVALLRLVANQVDDTSGT